MIVNVCSAIVRHEDTVLFVKETKPSAAGKWGLPGGKLEEGESIIDCVRREVLEETGYHVTTAELVYIVNKPKTHEGNTVVKFIFLCEVSNKQRIAAEHECQYLPIDTIQELDGRGLIRGAEILQQVQQSLHGSKIDSPILQII